MARARNIKPAFFENEEIAQLRFEVRLLFIGLWTLADRAGRLENRPLRIRMALFPLDEVDVSAMLGDLENSGLVKLYEVNGESLIWIPKLTKHQRFHSNEAQSELPPHPDEALPTKESSASPDSSTTGAPREAALVTKVNSAADQSEHRFALNEELGILNEERGNPNPETTNSADAEKSANADLVSVNPPEPKPRTPKQLASDARFERMNALYSAWCTGIGLDPESDEAGIGKKGAFAHLKSLAASETPTADDFGRATRCMTLESWRSTPPDIPYVIRHYSQWAAAGKPDKPQPKNGSQPRNMTVPDDGGDGSETDWYGDAYRHLDPEAKRRQTA